MVDLLSLIQNLITDSHGDTFCQGCKVRDGKPSVLGLLALNRIHFSFTDFPIKQLGVMATRLRSKRQNVRVKLQLGAGARLGPARRVTASSCLLQRVVLVRCSSRPTLVHYRSFMRSAPLEALDCSSQVPLALLNGSLDCHALSAT